MTRAPRSLRICTPEQLPELLPGALDGEFTLVPLPAGADSSWLHPDRPEPDAAVIVTTSGSTGSPKGVCLSADALVSGARATAARVGDRLTWWSPLALHHVAGLMTAVRAHVAGTRVEVLDAHLTQLPELSGPTALSLVPTQLHRALQRPELLDVLRRCTAILVGGAAAHPDLLDRARQAGLAIRTTYGMSETCGGCVYDGIPLDGVDVRLGGQGRISIAGPVLFSGYRDDPELTASTLVDGRLLTGDRGRWIDTDTGPRLEVIGRVDDVVISGGVNVDLAQLQPVVERVAHGWGCEATVLGVPDPEWGTAVVLVSTGEASVDRWRGALREQGLGAAALPQAVQQADSLKRTASGKIDRVWLTAHFAASTVRGRN